MKKQLLSILLCLIMVVGLLPTAALAEEGAPVFDLETGLADITIPDNLVTCTDKHTAQSPAPTIALVSRTDKNIKVTENSAWEYSIDNGAKWQDSCHFTNLQPGTEYSIIARVKQTATHQPSANSAPLNVTTMHTDISDEVKGKLRAVVSAYEGEYDSKEHEAVIVTQLPTGWTIAGYSTDGGNNFSNDIPKIKDAGTLRVDVKFVHPDYLMNITYSYTAKVTPTTITESDLARLNIPANLVTVKCETTGDSKAYGVIPGGFDLSKSKPYMDKGVLKAIVNLNLPAYKAKYDADTQKTHENAGVEGNTHAAFTLRYVNDKWELDGTFPNVVILVKCDGQHPQTPPHPTEENVGGLEKVRVRVKCSKDTAQFKDYGILPGSVSIMPDANNPSQATLTLIPSVYSKQYTIDTGITHNVAPNQNTDNLKIQMRYNSAVGKWMPAGELTPLEVLVQCNNHQGQRYTITFNGNGGTPSVTSMTTIDQKLPELPIATRSGRYSFDGWYTKKNGGTKITTATLFDKDTTVYAHWTYTGSTGGGVTTYPITVKSAKNGDVTASHKSAAKGTTITLTVDPDKGYVLDTLTVLDGKDKEIKLTEKNGKYTFTMPASKVTVAAMFKAEQSTGKNPFTDVPAGSYYEDAVIWAVDKGITTGTSATTFNPNGICTRAQAVTFLWRAAGSPAAKSSAMPFADVKAGSYYETAVLWAVENGITKGTSDTMFSPDATCTRAQIVTFLWRSQKSPAAGTANPFTDVKASAYYADAVLWAVKHNITVGTTFSIFSPDEECTRAQIVTFLYRAHNK